MSFEDFKTALHREDVGTINEILFKNPLFANGTIEEFSVLSYVIAYNGRFPTRLLDILMVLLNHGASAEVRYEETHVGDRIIETYDSPIIHFATHWPSTVNPEILYHLIDAGANVNDNTANTTWYEADTPLHIVTNRWKMTDTVRILIDEGANVNAVNSHDDIPLKWALIRTSIAPSSYDYVLLIAAGSKLDLLSNSSKYDLHEILKIKSNVNHIMKEIRNEGWRRRMHAVAAHTAFNEWRRATARK